MTNPITLLLAPGESRDADGVITPTSTGAVRTDTGALGDAWFLEEGTTNYMDDPASEGGLDSPGTGLAVEQITDPSAPTGGKSRKATITSPGVGTWGYWYSYDYLPPNNTVTAGDHITISYWYKAAAGKKVNAYFFTAEEMYTGPDHVASGEWERIGDTFAITTETTTDTYPGLRIQGDNGDVSYFTGVQIEAEDHATTYADGSLGTGYAWTGTAHASSSTRADASVAVDAADRLSPASGSVAFYLNREYDTGAAETIADLGTGAAGADRLTLRITAGGNFEMAWASNGAAETTVTSTETLAVGTDYLLYAEWDGTHMAVKVDNGGAATGTRDAAQGAWGDSTLTLGYE